MGRGVYPRDPAVRAEATKARGMAEKIIQEVIVDRRGKAVDAIELLKEMLRPDHQASVSSTTAPKNGASKAPASPSTETSAVKEAAFLMKYITALTTAPPASFLAAINPEAAAQVISAQTRLMELGPKIFPYLNHAPEAHLTAQLAVPPLPNAGTKDLRGTLPPPPPPKPQQSQRTGRH